jgi:hypothetical protein
MAWEFKAFADDIWKEADKMMRKLLKNQWKENKELTGGHTWSPPEWAEIDDNVIPLLPFKWDEGRRAVLNIVNTGVP